MSTKRLYLVILLLAIGCQQTSVSADKPTLPINEASTEAELDKQLKINKDALLKGTSEQIRIDAATIMLFSPDPQARKILLEALKQSENSAARVTVCKALSRARAAQEPINQKSDFVQPLLEVLTTETGPEAKLAAETTLIFEYDQIRKPLEKIVTEASFPAGARLNAIYALKLQPDMRAIFKLIKLVDDPQSQVASAASQALKSLGIPIGKDTKARKQIRDELRRKGKDAFLLDRLSRQEDQMRKLAAELGIWQELYLAASDKIYDGISGDVTRGKFLAEHLASSKAPVRLWALEKVEQWRKGTNPQLPDELGPALVNLVSDRNKDIRLKTAKLLSLMGELDSAQRLLQQLETEEDDEIRMELFIALGGACYYAFSPNSGVEIPERIREKTLELASEYLSEPDPKKAQKGAEVIRKLLEQDGLAPEDVNKYLDSLVRRYNRQENNADGSLRGELLNAMAGLCAQSVYKAESAKRFASLFEEALHDETNLVREAAVDGLIYIDKAKALKILRKDFVNDSSAIVRKKIIELASEVGGREDLLWLAEKIGPSVESEPAWQAMLKIFNGSDAEILSEWITKFDSRSTRARLSDEQKLSFLKIAERKAIGENKTKVLRTIREELAQLYSKIGEFERAAEYLGGLRKGAQTPEEKEAILVNLLDVYLKWPNAEGVANLVANRLSEKNLDPNDVIVHSIDNYLSKPPGGADPNVLLEALTKIKVPEARPKWAERLKRWTSRFGQASDPNEPKKQPGN